MTNANRGKVAESRLNLELKKLDTSRADFTYERIHDAHSSRGAMSAPRAGDFCLYHQGKNTLVEVKEVMHDYRLPCPSFGLDQRARLTKRQLAGTICKVVIFHSTANVWRVLPLSFFGFETHGSWDLRGQEELTLQVAVERLLT